jgi:hypothetical protein
MRTSYPNKSRIGNVLTVAANPALHHLLVVGQRQPIIGFCGIPLIITKS